jgi:ABC-2 type transport system permease protein
MVANGAGVIHDIGYQHYDGPRLGRRQIATALCWHSLRSALGLRRGVKAKIVPVIVLVIMCVPAVVNAVAVDLNPAHARIVNYDTYTSTLRIFLMLVFIAAQAPELVARDLRSKVLPLYFARPMRRLDYPAAKYVAFVIALLVMIDIPILLLYLGTVLQKHGWSQVWTETRAAIPGLLVGLMWAVVLAAVGLAVACLSGRRAFSTGGVAIFLFLFWTLAQLLTRIAELPPGGSGQGPGPGPTLGASSAAHLFGLLSPFTVLDGVRQWLGGTNPGVIDNPGHYGAAYGIMLVVFLGVSLAALFRRYAKVNVA